MTDCMSRPVVIRETDRSVSSGVNTVLYCVFFLNFILFFFYLSVEMTHEQAEPVVHVT